MSSTKNKKCNTYIIHFIYKKNVAIHKHQMSVNQNYTINSKTFPIVVEI